MTSRLRLAPKVPTRAAEGPCWANLPRLYALKHGGIWQCIHGCERRFFLVHGTRPRPPVDRGRRRLAGPAARVGRAGRTCRPAVPGHAVAAAARRRAPVPPRRSPVDLRSGLRPVLARMPGHRSRIPHPRRGARTGPPVGDGALRPKPSAVAASPWSRASRTARRRSLSNSTTACRMAWAGCGRWRSWPTCSANPPTWVRCRRRRRVKRWTRSPWSPTRSPRRPGTTSASPGAGPGRPSRP